MLPIFSILKLLIILGFLVFLYKTIKNYLTKRQSLNKYQYISLLFFIMFFFSFPGMPFNDFFINIDKVILNIFGISTNIGGPAGMDALKWMLIIALVIEPIYLLLGFIFLYMGDRKSKEEIKNKK